MCVRSHFVTYKQTYQIMNATNDNSPFQSLLRASIFLRQPLTPPRFVLLQGILCAIPLAFILPGLCYIRVEEGALWASNKRLAWAVAIFGFITFIAGTVSLFINFDELSQCSHGDEMPYCRQAFNTTQ